ncbi:MAG: phosphoribosylformylglycinamidine cyclo-ligase [Candidatus Peribacteraceae bacterium]|nr:phosphoribosylformylglycinamidine cyclo-ligase [Candidatus Peribacteraceae bacterium]
MKKRSSLSYAASGVNIAAKERALASLDKTMKTKDKRVLNTSEAFATLYDAKFPGYKHPVLVMKTEEPGSKQLLAFKHDRIESICADMINHLINDIIVMGATPLAVQDAVICGKLEKKVIQRVIAGVAAACRAQNCTLTGGETSEQPGVIPPGTYILAANIVGVVEKSKIIDGKKIKNGDIILAVASNGLHTNGYSLIRKLIKQKPKILNTKIIGTSFLNAILKPHTCYYKAVKDLFDERALHGMAHITGAGIEGNLSRVLPKTLDAHIDLSALRVLPIFKIIRDAGNIPDAEMLKTYNMGAGLMIVAAKSAAKKFQRHLTARGHACYPVGEIVRGKGRVRFAGKVRW